MNSLSWLLLITALAIGAVLSTSATKYLAKPLPPMAKSELVKEAKSAKSTPEESRPMLVAMPSSKNQLDLDDLWEKTLFNKQRTERIADAAEAQADAQAEQVNAEFELVGIARIGTPEDAKPIAIIKQKVQPARSRRVMTRAIRGRPVPTPAPAAEEETSSKPVQKIFRVGDSLMNTGYVVDEIKPEDNSVLLSRGGETVILKIQLADKQDSMRRDSVVNEALTAREKLQAAQEAESKAAQAAAQAARTAQAAQGAQAGQAAPAAAPPPPPPPPPRGMPPGVARPTGPTGRPTRPMSPAATNAEERQKQIERARILREKLLERQQQQQNQR
jgi:hypothetical protein